jgi:hypothetical protein
LDNLCWHFSISSNVVLWVSECLYLSFMVCSWMFLQFLLPFFVEFSSKSCWSGKLFLTFWNSDFDSCLSTNIGSGYNIHGFIYNLEVFVAYSIDNGRNIEWLIWKILVEFEEFCQLFFEIATFSNSRFSKLNFWKLWLE